MVEDRNGTILQKEDKMTGVKKAEILSEDEKNDRNEEMTVW